MWTEGQPTLSLCISNKMEACWALYNRFLPPLHLCLSMMVNHSLGRKANVLFMPSFELKCFSPCYINIYFTPSNTVIDSVRSLGTLSLLQWEGKCHTGTAAVGEELLPQHTDTIPDLFPFLQLPRELHRGPGKQRALLQPQHSRCCREAREPRAPGCWEQDTAPVGFRRNQNELRSKINKNFITFCFHKLMQLGAELS